MKLWILIIENIHISNPPNEATFRQQIIGAHKGDNSMVHFRHTFGHTMNPGLTTKGGAILSIWCGQF